MHFHVTLKLEFFSFDKNLNVFSNFFMLKLLARLNFNSCYFFSFFFIFLKCFNSQSEIFKPQLNPFTSFFSHCTNTIIKLSLPFTENRNISWLVSRLECRKLAIIEFFSELFEFTTSLSHHNRFEYK